MFRSLLKSAAPLVLLFALVFLTGVASTACAFTGAAESVLCCGKEAGEEFPAGDGECADPDCRCLSCCASILHDESLPLSSPLEPPVPHGALFWALPCGYSRAIDYPPEAV